VVARPHHIGAIFIHERLHQYLPPKHPV
jgi:hypothetical protein